MKKWINTKDELPSSPDICIVAVFNSHRISTYVEPMRYVDEKWYSLIPNEPPLDIEHHNVTHWMPLPEYPHE